MIFKIIFEYFYYLMVHIPMMMIVSAHALEVGKVAHLFAGGFVGIYSSLKWRLYGRTNFYCWSIQHMLHF